jgi:alkylhydroperoxidase family enzyme
MPKRTRVADAEREQRRAADRAFIRQASSSLRSSDGGQRWLTTRRRFHTSSLRDQPLIAISARGVTKRLRAGVSMSHATETLEEDMASNTRIPKAEVTGIYGAMVKRMSRKMLVDVAEPVEVAWHNRKVLNFSFSLGRKAQKWDQCDENLKSFAHMAVASLVGCSFCLDLGYFQAHNAGLDETKAREVPRWHESDVFTPLERDVMEYAEAMSQTPLTVTDELSARLLDQLGAPALVELTAYIALANLYTRTNIAFGIHSQGFSAACDLKPLALPTAA